MTKAQMKKYWLSDEWAKIKCDLISEYGFKCQWCGRETANLAVHHLTYENLGHEEPGDLVLICQSCHMKEHGIKEKSKNRKRTVKKVYRGKNTKSKSVRKNLPYYRMALMRKFDVKIKKCHGWIGLANKTAELHNVPWRSETGPRDKRKAKKYVKDMLS